MAYKAEASTAEILEKVRKLTTSYKNYMKHKLRDPKSITPEVNRKATDVLKLLNKYYGIYNSFLHGKVSSETKKYSKKIVETISDMRNDLSSMLHSNKANFVLARHLNSEDLKSLASDNFNVKVYLSSSSNSEPLNRIKKLTTAYFICSKQDGVEFENMATNILRVLSEHEVSCNSEVKLLEDFHKIRVKV